MKRPLPVTLTFWTVLILAIWNAVKAWTFLVWKVTLEEFSSRYPPLIGAAAGIVWLVTGLILAWGLWRTTKWSAKALPIAAAGYILWYWLVRLIWQPPRPNLLYVIVLDIATLILVYITSRSLSREAYERNIENPTIE